NETLPEKVANLVDLDNKEANFYVQMDERPARLQLQQELVDQGVIFTDIISAVKNHPELVKKYFMKDAVQVNEHKLTAFHA
ncbi:FeS cluster assembly protein sufD, partial [Escherichia coli]|nr:FeS cluster assembly protein sufD [Escherichia coli]